MTSIACRWRSTRPATARFEELALPAANKKNLGVIAMKVTGQEFLLGNGPAKQTSIPWCATR